MSRNVFCILTFLILFFSIDSKADVTLSHIFADNMVLQQNSKCPIFGFATAGEKIEITASWGKTTATTANNNGKWIANLQTPGYGGPYTIEIQGKNKIVLKNVLIGEVWLAAGEANMAMPLTGRGVRDTILGGYKAIAAIGQEDIRFINVPENLSFYPQEDFEGFWYPVDKSTVSQMSAVAYFFAHKLNAETGIPIGIINVNSVNSNCESWVSKDFLKKLPEFRQRLSKYDVVVPLKESFQSWVKMHPKISFVRNEVDSFNTSKFQDVDCSKLFFDDSKWGIMRIPSYIDQESSLASFDGVIWFRRWIDIPKEWSGKKLVLALGPIDDLDEAFVNGVKVGSTLQLGKWKEDRIYSVDGSLVKPGEMLIAIRLIDTGFNGGIYGRASEMKIYPEGEPENAIYLAGNWKYLPTGEIIDNDVYLYDAKKLDYFSRPQIDISVDNKTISAVYNAMISPLSPFKIAGVIWYQGESNVGRANEYLNLLPQLAHCFRDNFKSSDMKFYYAQIAPYEYGNGLFAAELREAQRRALSSIQNSGMVCLLDLGRKESILSAYKREAGERFANFALTELYEKTKVCNGPIFANMSVDKDKVILTFDNVGDGLVVRGAKISDFEISDMKGNFFPAEAELIDKNKIQLSSSKVSTPKNVRYCWKNYYKEVSLYNSAGLPASSFSTERKLLH